MVPAGPKNNFFQVVLIKFIGSNWFLSPAYLNMSEKISNISYLAIFNAYRHLKNQWFIVKVILSMYLFSNNYVKPSLCLKYIYIHDSNYDNDYGVWFGKKPS